MKRIVLLFVLISLIPFSIQAGTWIKSTGWPSDAERIVVRTMVRVNVDLYLAAGNPYLANGTVLYKSTNQGSSWTKVNQNLNSSCSVYHLLADGNTIFAGTNQRLYKSTDFGISWKSVNLPYVSKGLLKSGNSIYFASDNGMFISEDGFETWRKLDNFNGISSDQGTSAIAEMNGLIFTATTSGPWVLENSIWKPCGNIANTKNFHISKMVYSQGRYYLITFGNSFYSSTDATNWEQFDTPFTAHNIYALSDRVVLSLNTGGFFQCRDGGTSMVAFFNSGLKAGILYNSIQEFDGYILLGGYGEQGGSGIYRRALSDMNIPTKISDINLSDNISIYPNPCNKILNFDNLQPHTIINIFDYQGRPVFMHTAEHSSTGIDISGISPGIYLAVIVKKEERKTFRFVKE